MSETEFDYEIELKGKPKLDVTQPDSDTTKLIKAFKDFQLKTDGTNFKEFKSFLNALYVSQNSAMKKETYKLAEKLKIFPQIDSTNFQFEDRKKMTKEEKLEILSKIPEFTEDWNKLIGEIIEQISITVTESMLLVDTIWSGSEKMLITLEQGTPIAVQTPTNQSIPAMLREPTKEDWKLLAYEYKGGKSPSEIVDSHSELNLQVEGLSKRLALVIESMIKEQELQIIDVKNLPNWGTIKKDLKYNELPLSSQG